MLVCDRCGIKANECDHVVENDYAVEEQADYIYAWKMLRVTFCGALIVTASILGYFFL